MRTRSTTSLRSAQSRSWTKRTASWGWLENAGRNDTTLDDVARSYQRVCELGFDMALSIGQHTNDKELSYYARTPSGFEWEVGWNPITVDETTWQPATHQGISIWGHTPIGQTIVDKLDQFRRGARSLTRPEDTVPALSGTGIPDD